MNVLRPRNAPEALRAFSKNPKLTPLAGGTDFMVAWNAGQLQNRVVLDLSRLKEWKKIQKTKEGIRIGSLVTHRRIQEHPVVRSMFPLLVRACAEVGGWQIQNRGTLGGNIANASPAGDTFPPLSVYEGMVNVLSPRGRKRVPFHQVFAGVKKTTLQPGELIESIEIPYLKNRPHHQMFRKVGTRAAQAISKTVAAGLLWLKKDKTVQELRFALGSMAPTARRLKSVESFCLGKRMTPEVVDRACELLVQDVSPIDDIRSTREYRLRVSQNLLRSFLNG
ncbi:MAG: xanthine dehydrogenase family protein subunit M [Elusimicrobia bacterium]|nr:xanthine dehydrogenase family protein subunit M [Elusimicrobiota bacterium]